MKLVKFHFEMFFPNSYILKRQNKVKSFIISYELSPTYNVGLEHIGDDLTMAARQVIVIISFSNMVK